MPLFSGKNQKERNKSTSLPFTLSADITSGKVVAGDNYSAEQIRHWFDQEQEAYFDNDNGKSYADPWYSYMRYVNWRLGFNRISASQNINGNILILGPGNGAEVEEFSRSSPGWKITFLEASSNFKVILEEHFPSAHVICANQSGDVTLRSNSQDIICAFSVLHHIPNVTHVLTEVYRTLKPGGILLVREPCSSMGDWRYRRQATPNERGISRQAMLSITRKIGFVVAGQPIPILLAPLNSLLKRLGIEALFLPKYLFFLDRIISRIASCNDYYWRDRWYKRFGPSAYFYVFRKIS